MVVNGFSGPGDWGKTSTAITGPTGSDVTFTSIVVTGACCSPSRIPTYTEAKEKQDINVRAGKARFESIRPGTDAERMLSAIKSPRKLGLIVTAKDGTTIHMPLFQVKIR